MQLKNVNYKAVGWILSVLIPGLLLFYLTSIGLEWKLKYFLVIFSATAMMWIFRLSPEFVPSIFAIVAIIIMDVVPANVVLSGFTSGTFFMAMSIFGLAALLVSSGLITRIVLLALARVPCSQFWYSLILTVMGLVFTPLIPSANGRITLASPILTETVKNLGYRPSGKAATHLAIATFFGFTFFSGIFLSSKSINFVVYGLLPQQVREQFTWDYWIYAAAAAGITMFVLYLLLSSLMFRNNGNSDQEKLSREEIREHINKHLKEMKSLNAQEIAAMGGVFLFILGIFTISIHKIQLPWIGLSILYVLLAYGFLSKNDFHKNINWPFLIYLGALVGFVKSMYYVDFNQLIGDNISWLSFYMREHFLQFVLLLAVCIYITRIIVPNNAVVAIFAAVLFPVSEISGINPWITGFIILVLSDAWIMPYQCTYYLLFQDVTEKQNIYNRSLFLKFNFLSSLIRLVAVIVSLYYWKLIGIL